MKVFNMSIDKVLTNKRRQLMDKERRKFKRFDAYMSIKYKMPGDERREEISLSKDLSREGLKMNSTKDIQEGSMIDMEIMIPDDPKPVHTSGKIVWSQRSEGQNQGYDHGVRFTMMDPVDKFRILDYAYNHWLETKVNDFNDPEEISELG